MCYICSGSRRDGTLPFPGPILALPYDSASQHHTSFLRCPRQVQEKKGKSSMFPVEEINKMGFAASQVGQTAQASRAELSSTISNSQNYTFPEGRKPCLQQSESSMLWWQMASHPRLYKWPWLNPVGHQSKTKHKSKQTKVYRDVGWRSGVRGRHEMWQGA